MLTLLSPRQLAELLGVSLKTVYNMNFEGSGPPYTRVGQQCRYRLSDVEEWLDDHDVVKRTP